MSHASHCGMVRGCHDTSGTSDTSHQACGHNSGYDPEAQGFESLADSSLV